MQCKGWSHFAISQQSMFSPLQVLPRSTDEYDEILVKPAETSLDDVNPATSTAVGSGIITA